MLFLFQSFGRKYGKPNPDIYLPQARKPSVIEIDDDDLLLAAWFAWLARFYEQ